MCLKVNIILILLFSFLSNADNAVQTDWSGGDGVPGPVVDWKNEFYIQSNVYWDSIPGSLMLMQNVKHIIDYGLVQPRSVYIADINGDGANDVIGAYIGHTSWWENIDEAGTEWIEYVIDSSSFTVYSDDIDNDGDMDVLGTSNFGRDVTWWENTNGSGTSWTKNVIGGDNFIVDCVRSEDIDGDGDMDVISSAFGIDHRITWWENTNGSGTSWIMHSISGVYTGSRSVYSEDVDGDGDKDILSADHFGDLIEWFENLDGSGLTWTEHLVDNDFNGANSIHSEDLDGDGDMDIIGAAYYDNDIAWWENQDGFGTSWNKHQIETHFYRAQSVYSADIDADGDIDVLGAALVPDDVVWWENDDENDTWIEHYVDANFNGVYCILAEDINGDDRLDVVGAAFHADQIAWWDLTPSAWLESSIFDTQSDPEWDYFGWTSFTTSGTSVSFQVRASDNYTEMGEWSDTLETPCYLSGVLNDGDRYVQYKAILETSNPDSTPTLNDVTITWNPLGIGETAEPIPPGTELLPFSPNPVAGSPIIRFGLHETAFVDISVFDLSGRLVTEVIGYEYSPGFHDVLLEDLSPGIYFCRMMSGDFTATQRFVVID